MEALFVDCNRESGSMNPTFQPSTSKTGTSPTPENTNPFFSYHSILRGHGPGDCRDGRTGGLAR